MYLLYFIVVLQLLLIFPITATTTTLNLQSELSNVANIQKQIGAAVQTGFFNFSSDASNNDLVRLLPVYAQQTEEITNRLITYRDNTELLKPDRTRVQTLIAATSYLNFLNENAIDYLQATSLDAQYYYLTNHIIANSLLTELLGLAATTP